VLIARHGEALPLAIKKSTKKALQLMDRNITHCLQILRPGFGFLAVQT
jgi:hypothetical protein